MRAFKARAWGFPGLSVKLFSNMERVNGLCGSGVKGLVNP